MITIRNGLNEIDYSIMFIYGYYQDKIGRKIYKFFMMFSILSLNWGIFY